MKKSGKLLSTLILSLVLLTGCATKQPSFGDSAKAEGKYVSAIGTKWEKGQALLKKGNKLVHKVNKQLADGNNNVKKGKALIRSGEKLIADSEKEYKRLNSTELYQL